MAGKLARKPGPVIRNIALKKDPAPVLIVQGENLASTADFFVDGKKLPIDPNATTKLVTATPQKQLPNQSFCSEPKIVISDAADLKLDMGDHLFRITNPDGQFAEARFTADQPSIVTVSENPQATPGTKEVSAGDELKTVQ